MSKIKTMSRKKTKMYKLIVTLVSLLCFQAISAAPHSVDDFAYSSILSEAKTSLRQIELPLSVYEKMQRKDYGDLRVFSADGQIVPHQFNRLTRQIDSNQNITLVFYPLSKEQAANPSNLQIVISNNTKAGEQKLSINQQLSSDVTKSNEYQYIIENSNKNKTLCKLKLDWTQAKSSSILMLKLESSNKLQNWKTLKQKATVSKLNYAGSQLVNNEISFPCTTQKYLRLTWLQAKQAIQLHQIQGIYLQKGEQKTQWTSLGKPHYDEKEESWLFESHVVAALSKLEFIAPQNGLFYKGALYSRNNNEKQAWRFRKDVTQYRLNIGDSNLQSSPLAIMPNKDRYWKMVMATEGRLNENQLPEIRAGWMPQEIHFLAQGKEPFTLAFGNPVIKPAQNNDLSTLIASLKESGASIDKVTLGSVVNNSKIFEAETEIPWKLILLWLVLILGTALMGFMAVRLYQQMSEEKR